MRILAVTPYASPEGGGLERYAHAILTRLARRGHAVHQIAFTRSTPPLLVADCADSTEAGPVEANSKIRPAESARSATQAGGGGGFSIERVKPSIILGNTPLHPRFKARVAAAIRGFRPDVVVGHTPVPFACEMAYLAARRAGVPFVATYHAGSLRGSSPWLGLAAALDRATLEAAMLRGASGLIAVSPYVRDHALARRARQVHVVPPGVDARLFCPGADAGEPRPDVLFVGPLDRSYRWKGLDTLLAAFSQVRAQVPDARLVLVGEGDRRAEVEAGAAAREGAVVVRGRLSEEGLAQAYRDAAVTVLPSTSDAESFGMVLAEANACGRPVVASQVGGIPSFVQPGRNGVLVPPGDEAALARQVVQLLRSPDERHRLGRRGRERVLRRHDWDRLALVTEAVLSEAVRPRQPATRC